MKNICTNSHQEKGQALGTARVEARHFTAAQCQGVATLGCQKTPEGPLGPRAVQPAKGTGQTGNTSIPAKGKAKTASAQERWGEGKAFASRLRGPLLAVQGSDAASGNSTSCTKHRPGGRSPERALGGAGTQLPRFGLQKHKSLCRLPPNPCPPPSKGLGEMEGEPLR